MRQESASYFGWKVIAAMFVAGFLVYGGGLYCFVLFVQPLTDEFHWSRAATGGIVSAFWLPAPLILLGGWAVHRFGIAKLVITGIVLEAVCVLMLATVSSLWQIYLLRAAMGMGKLLFAITVPVTAAAWFSRRFALALGLSWAGWHLGGMVLSPITAYIIAHSGWRAACVSLSGALLLIALPSMLWVLKKSNSGASKNKYDAQSPVPSELSTFAGGGLRHILGKGSFWTIALATLCYYTAYGGLLAHQAAIVEGAGYSILAASWILGSTAGFAALGGLIIGWALDEYSLTRMALLVNGLLLAGALSLLVASRMPTMVLLILYSGCFGLAVGGSDVFFVKLMRVTFPASSMAHTYSAWYCVELISLLTAPIAAGWLYDRTGSYQLTLLLLFAAAILAALLCLAVMRKPVLQPVVSAA